MYIYPAYFFPLFFFFFRCLQCRLYFERWVCFCWRVKVLRPARVRPLPAPRRLYFCPLCISISAYLLFSSSGSSNGGSISGGGSIPVGECCCDTRACGPPPFRTGGISDHYTIIFRCVLRFPFPPQVLPIEALFPAILFLSENAAATRRRAIYPPFAPATH